MKHIFTLLSVTLLANVLLAQTTKATAVAPDTLPTQQPAAVTEPKTAQPQQTTASAPKPEKERRDTRPLKDRIGLGLGFGFWMNTSQTYIEVAPSLAYRFPKRLTTGVGYRYIYRHYKDNDQNMDAYGPNVFAKLDLLKRVYLWSEYEYLTSEYEYSYGPVNEVREENIDSWFVGLGYSKSVGKKGRSGLSIQVLYNVLYTDSDYDPYYSPVIYRIGYFF